MRSWMKHTLIPHEKGKILLLRMVVSATSSPSIVEFMETFTILHTSNWPYCGSLLQIAQSSCASIHLGPNLALTLFPILTKIGKDNAVEILTPVSFGQTMCQCTKGHELSFTQTLGDIFWQNTLKDSGCQGLRIPSTLGCSTATLSSQKSVRWSVHSFSGERN